MGHTCLHEGGAKGRQGGQAGGAPYWGGEWGTHACMRGGAKGRQGGQAGGAPYWEGEWGTHACMTGGHQGQLPIAPLPARGWSCQPFSPSPLTPSA